MPKLIIPTDDFELNSLYACGVTKTIATGDATETALSYNYYLSDRPAYANKTKSFEYSLPAGSEIKAMKVYATIGKSDYALYISSINGQNVGLDTSVSVDIDISGATLAGTVDVLFAYQSPSSVSSHQHDPSEGTETSRSVQGANTVIGYKVWHGNYLEYKKVYLEIEYTCGVYLYHGEDGVLVPYQLYHAENGELIPCQLFKCVSTEEELSRIAQCMQDEYQQANVDLLNRPQVDWTVMNAAGWDTPEGSYSTVDTVTYTPDELGLSGDYAINVTPILQDGTVIEGGWDGLRQYINNELSNGKQFEDLDIFLGRYDTVEEAEAAAQRLHELQEAYYTLKKETADNILVQY